MDCLLRAKCTIPVFVYIQVEPLRWALLKFRGALLNFKGALLKFRGALLKF